MTDNQIFNHDINSDGSSNGEKIKLDDDDGNDRGGGNIRDINITFYSVWRNIVIRNEILFHTRLFNIHLGRCINFTMEELSTYKYKSYLDVMLIYSQEMLYYNKHNYDKTQQLIPLLSNVIPYGVSDVSFDFRNLMLLDNSIPNTVTTVRFFDNQIKQKFIKGILPDSITSLKFGYGTSFNQSLAGGWLPNSLKLLSLPRSFQRGIGVNQLPESLIELNIKPYTYYQGKIEPGSIPSTVAKPLNYTWKCECKEKLTDQESSNIPISNINYGIGQCIKEGDIPHNAISIKFSDSFKGEILGALPESLKSLQLKFRTHYFNNKPIGSNVLSSSNLTSIDIYGYDYPLVSNLFPQSVTSIKFRAFNKPIPEGYFYNYTNLKSLKFSGFNQVIPDKSLPPSLKSLKLDWDFYQEIQENTLPPSLTSLKLSYYHPLKLNVLPPSLSILKLCYHKHPLNVNMLPSSLSTFEIGSQEYKLGIDQLLPPSITSLSLNTEHPIPVGSLPCNLKVLYINYPNFNQDLTEEGILPNSIQTIYFNHKIDKNYINNLNVDFFKKYIRFIK